MTESTTVLSARNINIGYLKGNKICKLVHENISFTLKSGELTSLLGPNGAGKSTLLRSISGSQPLLKGSITINGRDISQYNRQSLSRLISLVLTDRGFTDSLRVEEVVGMGRHPYTGFFGRLSSNDEKIIEKAMRDTGIYEKKDSYISDLSDGERQKAMIAKALTQESDIIILDEPTSFLDIISRIEINNLLRKLARENNKTILLSTHDLEQALISSDKLLLLSRTEGIREGIPEDLIFSGELDKLFSHNRINFNIKAGSFVMTPDCGKMISITGNEDTAHWIENLIRRYGFIRVDDNDKSLCEIMINDNNNFLIRYGNAVKEAGSFEEIKEFIIKL